MRSKQKFWTIAVAILAIFLAFIFFTKPGRTFYKVLRLTEALNPKDSSLEPTNAKHNIISYEDGNGTTEALMFKKGDKSQGAVIISGGVGLTGYNWALIDSFAANLANLGITVMIPKPESLNSDIVTEDSIKSYVNAFKYLENQNKIDKSKIGFLGFCAGGSFVLLAAEDPEINNQVSVISVFSPYNNLIDYYAQAFSHEAITSSGTRPWEPAEETVSALTKNFNYRVTPYLQQNSQAANSLRDTLGVINRKGDVGRTKKLILESLPEKFLEEAKLLSPDQAAANIKSEVYIIHDYNDTFTPREESQRLASEIGPNAKLLMPTIFDHTILQKNVTPIRWATEGLKVLTVFYKILYKLS